ncbi:MAG: thrombospondin type 3 repeat-containing protein [Deltaproteobacteria bacterium]|nr:thrombospondin type 3 repeat-containing protein [Deltaproteobacteria bacterium]
MAVAFRAETTDLTPLDLGSMRAELRDNLNNLIDITQYVADNCDVLKRNCTFAGDVSIPDGTYTLKVKVCNTAAACTTKEVTFVLGATDTFPDLGEWWEDFQDQVEDVTQNIMDRWRKFTGGCYYKMTPPFWPPMECNKSIDPDCDGVRSDMSDCDNCPDKENADQVDTDRDGLGDACDPDIDNDGLTNDVERGLGTNERKVDSDDDGILDPDEITIGTNPNAADTNGDGISDFEQIDNGQIERGKKLPDGFTPKDSDGDGTPDASDPDPANPQKIYPVWLASSKWSTVTERGLPVSITPISPLFAPIDTKYGVTRSFVSGLVQTSHSRSIPELLTGTGGFGGTGTYFRNFAAKSPVGLADERTWDASCVPVYPESDLVCGEEVVGSLTIACEIDYFSTGWATVDKQYFEPVYNIQGNTVKVAEMNDTRVDPKLFRDFTHKIDIGCTTFDLSPSCAMDACKFMADNNLLHWEFDESRAVTSASGDNYEEVFYRAPVAGCDYPYSFSVPQGSFLAGEPFTMNLNYRYDPCVRGCDPLGWCEDPFWSAMVYYRTNNAAGIKYSPVKINKPVEADRKQVFTAASPGLIVFSVEGNVEFVDTTKDKTLEEYFRWSMTIGDSALMWISGKWGTDPAYGKGVYNIASFRTLPSSNAHFGKTPLKFEMLGPGNPNFSPIPLDQAEMLIFFPLSATNHPYLQDDQAGTPNWYYYWNQVLDIKTKVREILYNPNKANPDSLVESCQDKGQIRVGTEAMCEFGIGCPGDKKFIDGYAGLLEHELGHNAQRIHNYCVHGADGSVVLLDPSVDYDRDGICDSEVPGSYNPTDPATCGGWEKKIGTECDRYNGMAEDAVGVWAGNNPTYYKTSFSGLDWACPGSQIDSVSCP